MCQHATYLVLNHALIVYGIQGGIETWMMILHISQDQPHALFTFQQKLVDTIIQFSYG